jgi:drug/metabolite transporter (DMT)-like permease
MNALTLGLIAAICWGFHDICVRFLSQKVPISGCIFIVLVTGLLFHLGLMGLTGGFQSISNTAIWLSLAAGVFFVTATFGLYNAFQRGPVRLVAPLIASYPILSVAWAATQGTPISLWQWIAVLAIVAGVAVVAALSDDSAEDVPSKGPTILFALIAAVGFAGTFAFGQLATETSHEMPSTLVTRLMSVALSVAILVVFKLPFWPGFSAMPWLIAMGVADGIALLCVLSAGNFADAQYAAVASSMFGLLTILMAWAFLKERMTLPQWAGCLVAFAGVGYLAI